MIRNTLHPRNLSDMSQGWLFTSTSEEFVVEMSVSCDEMASWQRKGWLSFDPTALIEYSQPERIEVLFIKGLTRSGLSDALINRTLASLEKPYCYDPDKTFYSFLENCWISLPLRADPADITSDYITELAEAEKWDALRELQGRISEALEAVEDTEDG